MALKSLTGLRQATALPIEGPVDTGNDLLNAIQRGSRAQSRVVEQNQADADAGYNVPWWAQRRLNSPLGMDLGSQLIEAQNEIADTGQQTRVRYGGAPSLLALQALRKL